MKPDSTSMRFYYDVFGTVMRVERNAIRPGSCSRYLADGKSSRVGDVSIPDHLQEEELGTFLDDMFHEYATPVNDKVIKLR